MFQGKSKEEREALMAKLGTANFGVARSAEVPAPWDKKSSLDFDVFICSLSQNV